MKKMDSINKRLNDLYSSKWGAISEALQEIANEDNPPEPTNPLLLYIDKEEKWQDADLRVMVFGQETMDWENSPDKSIEHLCDVYNRFFNEKQGRNSPFWNGFARFRSTLDPKYPEKKIRYIWNNIVKIGMDGKPGRPPRNIYDAERKYFHVIMDEIKILKPNIFLFFTGPHYDDVIRDNFGEITFSEIKPYRERELAKISISEVDFAFRIYHPNYLRRIKRNINDYFDAIVKEIIY